jgi:hypothetical protein
MIAEHVQSLSKKFGERVGIDAQVSNWFVELEKGDGEEVREKG